MIERERLQNNNSTVEQELSNSLTDEARRMTNELSLGRSFNRSHLRGLLDDPVIGTWDLPPTDFKHAMGTAQSSNKLEHIPEIQLKTNKAIIPDTRAFLEKTVSPSKTIERLKQDISIETWVREGLSLHVGKRKCEFCQNNLPMGFLEELHAHFSKEYESFRSEVNKYLEKLETQKLSPEFGTRNDLYPEFQEEYLAKVASLEKIISKYNTTINHLVEFAIEKTTKLSENVVLPSSIVLHDSEIERLVREINYVIQQHNRKTSNFEKFQEEAIERLKKYYAFQFYKNRDYADIKKKIETTDKRIQDLTSDIEVKDKDIREIELRISESVKGSELMNNVVKRYFGQNTPIEIRVIDDRFHVFRGDLEAKNLSEGEKTAISFSYFLTRLNDKDTKDVLADTIVYIDDPVSSLDSNHLYNTYALIATCLRDKCGQLFISTHNFEFFNLLKDEFKKQRPKDCNYRKKSNHECHTNLYQIERNADNAWLDALDCILCNFKSEYHYLFYKLYQFAQESDTVDDYRLYTMPNLLRRFLETYLGFAFPSCKSRLRDGLNKLIVDDKKRKFVHKIADEFSHSENIERALKLYTTGEIKDAIQITFDAFDQDYLEELRKSVGI